MKGEDSIRPSRFLYSEDFMRRILPIVYLSAFRLRQSAGLKDVFNKDSGPNVKVFNKIQNDNCYL